MEQKHKMLCKLPKIGVDFLKICGIVMAERTNNHDYRQSPLKQTQGKCVTVLAVFFVTSE